jgi:hypothetical protein
MSRKNKYRNVKTEYRGRVYASKLEADYAINLDWKKHTGEIIEWAAQVRIPLKVNDIKICDYIVDFVVIDKNDKRTFVECKGYETKEYKLKAKLVRALYPEYNFIVVK